MRVLVNSTIREATKKACKRLLKSASKTKKRKTKLKKNSASKFFVIYVCAYVCAIEIFFACLLGNLVNPLTLSFDNQKVEATEYFATNRS